jgi:hypothetical protein
MNRLVVIILVAASFTCCTGSYDLGLDLDNAKPQVVVNSIITPDSTINVQVVWSKSIVSFEPFKPIEGAKITIAEDDQIVFSGVTNSRGLAGSSYYPKAGKKYYLRVLVEGKELTASTSIPENSEIKFTVRQKDKTNESPSNNFLYMFADISSIQPEADIRSLYITFLKVFEEGQQWNTAEQYTNSPFVDQINLEFGDESVGIKESNRTYISEFLRIPASYFDVIAPVTISTEAYWRETKYYPKEDGSKDDFGYPIFESESFNLKEMHLNLWTPSDEFDQFSRSVYQQVILEISSTPFNEGTTRLYSNINNGLGIFAGFNVRKYNLNVQIPSTD